MVYFKPLFCLSSSCLLLPSPKQIRKTILPCIEPASLEGSSCLQLAGSNARAFVSPPNPRRRARGRSDDDDNEGAAPIPREERVAEAMTTKAPHPSHGEEQVAKATTTKARRRRRLRPAPHRSPPIGGAALPATAVVVVVIVVRRLRQRAKTDAKMRGAGGGQRGVRQRATEMTALI